MLQAAEELSLILPESFCARVFNSEQDIVAFDLLLVMDKYTAADVLREVGLHPALQCPGCQQKHVCSYDASIAADLHTKSLHLSLWQPWYVAGILI